MALSVSPNYRNQFGDRIPAETNAAKVVTIIEPVCKSFQARQFRIVRGLCERLHSTAVKCCAKATCQIVGLPRTTYCVIPHGTMSKLLWDSLINQSGRHPTNVG